LKIDIYFYTGTGNSLWTARMLARELGGAEVLPITGVGSGTITHRSGAVGIIFPVHIWGVPHRVIDFIDALPNDPSTYFFAVAVNAGQVAATLLQLKTLMKTGGRHLSSGFSIVMPSNYIPWGGPGPEALRLRRIETARAKITTIAPVVARREERPVEKGPLWQNILFSWFYRMSFSRVPSMDKSFRVDEKCNSCGICRTVCPCGNIDMVSEKPVWRHGCEQCLACIQWCPQEAIQFGKKTSRYERYHHPEVTLRDMVDIEKTASL
jgi:ferredoxin